MGWFSHAVLDDQNNKSDIAKMLTKTKKSVLDLLRDNGVII